MGIQGLLPLLKSTMVPIHIKDLGGCCVAVDTYSWLHKGALSCSTQLCKGLPTSRHIEYCMHRVNLLRHYGVKPILVFDGGLLPMKMEQENKRARSRKENLVRAIEHEANGNSAAAYDCYQKAVDISPLIAHELIQVLKQENVAYVVAPYEADAQMTFLAMSKQVDVVITEDSDLIPFGCPRIMFKMDKYGQGVEFQYARLQMNRELGFSGFNHKMLLEMCILSGCDYLPSLPGMGLKRAHALIMKFKSYDKVIKHLKYSTVSVPPLYEESFKKAILTFQHQRVYDPISEDIVHLSNVHCNDSDDLHFLGPSMPQHIAKAIATGDMDPFTKMPFQGESVNSVVVMERTSKYEKLKPETGRKKLDLPVQKNLLTKYFCFASLEAKRKFRAPRSSPPNPSSTEGSYPNPSEHSTEKITACNINCNMASSLDSMENSPCSSFPKNNSAESDSVDNLGSLESLRHSEDEKESQDRTSVKQIVHSTHKLYQALLMECDYKNVPSAVHDKTRTKNAKALVRSSYFQHKSANKSDQYNIQERLSGKDDVAIKDCEDKHVELSCNLKTANEDVMRRSPYFQHNTAKKNWEDNKQRRPLLKNDAVIDTCEDTTFQSSGNLRTANKNVTLRNSYFLEKSENKYDPDNGQERLLIKDTVFRDSYEVIGEEDGSTKNNLFDSFSMKSENNPFDNFSMKRKTSLNCTIEKENMKTKYMRTNASIATTGCNDSNLDEAVVLTKTEEGKFGSDISHLSRYSNIAEESMGRFVSMLGTFRYSSSGSRASGLRAPLKDMQNTRTNESGTTAVDFSRFAYAPTNKKMTASASRRR